MARKTVLVQITAEGRDKGKTFLITEFAPRRAEGWAVRALSAISRSGASHFDAETVEAIKSNGMAAMAALGMRALTSIAYDEAQPLLDEMLETTCFVPDASKVDKTTMLPFARPMVDEDVEEISTLLHLRDQWWELHTGFSIAAYLSELGSAAKVAVSSSSSPTSPLSSDKSSD